VVLVGAGVGGEAVLAGGGVGLGGGADDGLHPGDVGGDAVALGGEVGKSVAVARRSGADWYIGALTNWDKRDMELKLDFLPAGKTFRMTSFADGVNANIMAMDYIRKQSEVSAATTLPIHMARNGGWCASIDLGK